MRVLLKNFLKFYILLRHSERKQRISNFHLFTFLLFEEGDHLD